jgi:signal transduction histidine kinase
MGIPESKLFCRLEGLTPAARVQRRLSVLTELGLLEPEGVPVFEEATQTAAHLLEVPICILSVLDQDQQWLKSAVGLSRLGLMNDLAMSRQIPIAESFCINVVDSQQVLAIADTYDHPAFAHSRLTQQYGIRAYLAVPLVTSSGDCIGTLAVMDLAPRHFTHREMELLILAARLSISEYERAGLTKTQVKELPALQPAASQPVQPLKFQLLSQLTQELRTPLTSVMGMASVLNREIYGPLTSKQKEYMDIIHTSGEYLLSLVKEILELSQLDDRSDALNLAAVDIEMLCQQAISTLEQAAGRREQQIRLTVEPGNRIWALDKEKIRQMLYHLTFSVIQASNTGSVIRLHVSNKGSGLKLTIWTTHPCLGDGLYADMYEMYPPQPIHSLFDAGYDNYDDEFAANHWQSAYSSAAVAVLESDDDDEPIVIERPRKNLGLLLSQFLVEMHGGTIVAQGGSEAGQRYTISLPRLNLSDNLTD